MIEILDEVLAGTPKYRITDNNGNIVADNVTIEMITQILQAGTPMNKSLFERFETDYTNQINAKIELSDVYNVGTLATEIRELTDTFTDPKQWQIESEYRVNHPYSGFSIMSSSNYSDYGISRFVDGNDSSYAMNTTGYMTIQRPVAWKLKQIRAYFTVESNRTLRIGTENTLRTAGTYNSYTSEQYATNRILDVNLNVSQTDFYFRALTGTSSFSSYDINPHELYAITYETNCNILSYSCNFTIADGTVVKFKTPSNLNENLPTILKIGNTEINFGMKKANTRYEFVWNDLSTIHTSLPISIKVGIVSDGGTIPKTEGYNNYIYFVSPYSAGADSAEANSYEADGNGWSITCSVNQNTRVVTSKAVSKTRRDSDNEYTGITTRSATANYLEIAWN